MPNKDTLILLNSLSDKYDHGLAIGNNDDSGCFVRYDEGTEALERIVKVMKGNCTRRESIPSVFAQEILFQLCVEHYSRGQNAPAVANPLTANQETQQEAGRSVQPPADAFRQVVSEWKGALAAHLLMDELLDTGPDFKHDWYLLTLDPNVNHKHRAMLPKDNLFVQGIQGELPSGNPTRSWEVFLIQRDDVNEEEPLMQRSEELIVIPAANLNGFSTDQENVWLTSIPWLKVSKQDSMTDGAYRIHFTDPLEKMILPQLDALKEKLSLALTEQNQSLNRLALERFRNEVSDRIEEVKQNENEKLQRVEEILLEALLLRDALKSQLTIVSGGQNRQQVYLGRTRLATLDKDRILILDNPYAYIGDEHGFKNLCDETEELMRNPACHHHVSNALVNNLSLTTRDEAGHRVDCPIVQRLKNCLQEEAGHQHSGELPGMIRACLKQKGAAKEIQGNELLFPCFDYQFVPPLEDKTTFFSKRLAVFRSQSPTQAGKAAPMPNDNGFYNGPLLNRGWYTLNDLQFLLPLGYSGAYFFLPKLDTPANAAKMDIAISKQNENFIVAVRMNKLGTWYEVQKVYTPKELIQLNASWQRPAVGVWPDLRYTQGQNRDWKDFYTYLYSRDYNHTIEAHVFYSQAANGQPVSDVMQHHTADKESWKIAQSKEFPLFVELHYNQAAAGVIPCAPFRLVHPNARCAVLAIDFGMSGTVGAFVRHDVHRVNRAASIQPAAFAPNESQVQGNPDELPQQPATSGIAWQFNHDQGMRFSANTFLSDWLSTIEPTKRSTGAIFSIIRRFHDATETDAEPFHHGNIQFIGFDNQPEYTDLTYSGLKLAPVSVPLNKANMSLFLHQILEMYWLRCYQKGIKQLDVRFAYPLAMPTEQQQGLCEIMYNTCERLSAKTGIQLEALRVSNESRAVQTYFRRGDELTGIRDDDIIVTIDIGGGTTDFSIIVRNRESAQEAYYYYSTTLAGNTMFAHHLYEGKGALENQKNLFLKIGQAKPLGMQPLPEKYFILRTDQLMRNGDQDLLDMIQNQHSPIHHVLVFELCLIFWTARMLYEPHASGASQSSMALCLAGNGSKFYHLLDDASKDQIRAVVFSDVTSFDVIESREQKMEVVKGLALMEPDELQHVTSQAYHINNPAQIDVGSPADLWACFSDFLNRYSAVFVDQCVIAPILSNSERLERLRRDFTQRCISFEQLVEYLPRLCRMLEITHN